MPRLRTVSPSDPGWTRRRRGRGFSYVDERGECLADPDLSRCKELVIPPAWQSVWICPHPNGHIQAVGVDDAGRRQYLYHPQWRLKRDADKHERVLTVACRLPKAREQVAADLALEGMPRERALATAFRLLDLGFFRIGGETYADENGSYGLATMLRTHVTIRRDRVEFEFPAKSGKDQHISIHDSAVRAAVATMKRRRSKGEELLAYRAGGRWRDVTSTDINDYIRETIDADVSAKDFRTWHATVLAAVALAVSLPTAKSKTARKRAVARAMSEVADYLGNTPAVARASYVNPRLVDLFEDGRTIEKDLGRIGEGAADEAPATHGAIEEAVIRLLS